MKRSALVRNLCLLPVLFLTATVQLWGQTGTTQVFGQITDPQGAAVVGAKVTATNEKTGLSREEDTDSEGNFRISALPPGIYNLKVEAAGFRTAARERVELLVDTAKQINLQLKVGAQSETVEVRAAAEALNTSDASVGNAFNEDQIKQLPLEGRNVVNLLSLQPGAVYVPAEQTPTYGDPRQGSISGSRADQTNVTLDGVDVNDNLNGYAYTSVLRNTLDSVQEFRVTTSNYGAEQGRSSAAQVTLVTKSGSNNFHGSAYWAHRNTAFSSNEFFNKQSQLKNGEPNKPPKLQKHIWGWSLGGPILKDRLFFFANMENLRQISEEVVQRQVPSGSFRDGVLIYHCANPSQCPAATVSGLTGTHQVPAGYHGLTPAELASLDPLGIGPSTAASQYFKQYPLPNAAGRDIYNFGELKFAGATKPILWTDIARFDFKADPAGKHTFYWRGNLQDDVVPGAPQFPGQKARSSTLANNKGFALGYTSVLSNQLVNTFRYGFTRVGSSTAGQRTGNYAFFRFFDEFTPQTSSSFTHIPTHNFVDDLSWNKGAHTLQFGTNIRFVRVERQSNANSFLDVVANGSWVANVGTTYMPGGPDCPFAACTTLPAVADDAVSSFADGFIDILGIMSEVDAVYNYDKKGNLLPIGTPIARRYASNAYEFYAQDNWRLKPNLNVVFGLRYSLASPPWETNGLQVAPTINMGQWFDQRRKNMLAGVPDNKIPDIVFDLAGPANGKPHYYPYDRNNFSPRVSFSYSPSFSKGILGALTGGPGKTVVRGGYSLVYDNIGQALAARIADFASFGLSTQLSSSYQGFNEDEPGIRYVNSSTIPTVSLPPAPPGGFPTTPPSGGIDPVDGPFSQGQITSGIDNSLVTPYAHMFNFMIGRQMPGDMTLEVGYVGRRGRDLLTRRDLAMPLNLVDPKSGMDYFGAVKASLAAATAAGIPAGAGIGAYSAIAPIPYWENLFPDAAGFSSSTSTATMEMVRQFNRRRNSGDFTTPLYNADEFCFPACSALGQFAYFNRQFDSLGAISSLGISEYHSMQVSLRKRYSHGLQFDLNYTLSKASDTASAVERGSFFTAFDNGGYTGFLINSWDPRQSYQISDFDVRHQINLNWVWDLPVGRNKLVSGLPGWANAIVGDWQFTGIYRWTSGFPFTIQNCRSCWPTNWNLQGNAIPIDPKKLPSTGHFLNVVDGNPSPFKDPAKAYSDFFRRALPGEGSVRNLLRGDGYFNIDVGIGKSWTMPYKESHKLKFRWEIFNLTNSARFNVGDVTMLPDSVSFGAYNSAYSGCDSAAGRCMQAGLRYEF